MFASLSVLLYVSHLTADYPLQTDHQAAHKAEKSTTGWRANLTHAGTHVLTCGVALLVGVLVLDLSVSVPVAVAVLLWIGATHSVIDRRWPIRWWMTRTGSVQFFECGGAAHVDQTAHVLALVVAALALAA